MSDNFNIGDITLSDLGIDLDVLYKEGDESLQGLDTSCVGLDGDMKVDTKAMPNLWTISAKAALPEKVKPVERAPMAGRIAHISEAGKKDKTDKTSGKDSLKGWFGMQRRELTPTEQAEIRAIQLKRFADPFSATSAGNPKNIETKMPKYFQFATEVDAKTGKGGIDDTKKRGGRSLLEEMLNDSEVTAWATRKTHAVQEKASKKEKYGFQKFKKSLLRQKRLNKK